jgi:hypothetical protein
MAEDGTHESARLEDLYLSDFQKNNPQCEFSMDEGKFVIERPWSVSDIRFAFDPQEVDLLRDINNIAFRAQFDAVFHLDLNEVEFLFAYLLPDEEPMKSYIDRGFTFTFLGTVLECAFREPSPRLYQLAKRMRRLSTDRDPVAVQLAAFKDVQRLDKLPEKARDYFAKRVPRSFFVKTEKPLLNYDWEQLARHINFQGLKNGAKTR